MDRKEFSAMVKAARERKGVSKYQVHLDSRLTETQILYIERADNSYNMVNLFKILEVCDLTLLALSSNNQYELSAYEDVTQYLVDVRDQNKLTNYRVCKDLNLSRQVLSNIINQKCVASIDTFLKLTNYFGYTLSIVDKEEQA